MWNITSVWTWPQRYAQAMRRPISAPRPIGRWFCWTLCVLLCYERCPKWLKICIFPNKPTITHTYIYIYYYNDYYFFVNLQSHIIPIIVGDALHAYWGAVSFLSVNFFFFAGFSGQIRFSSWTLAPLLFVQRGPDAWMIHDDPWSPGSTSQNTSGSHGNLHGNPMRIPDIPASL